MFNFTRRKPDPTPIIQAHAEAVETVRKAKARRNDGATGMAYERARVDCTRRLAAEIGKASPL